MSDDEGDYDYGDDGPPPAAGGGEPEFDADGFPIGAAGRAAAGPAGVGGGGRLQAQLNPLQQKMERERKEREAAAAAAKKKAALASKLAAFGGAKGVDAEKAAREKEEAEKKAAAERASRVPKAEKAQIDSRVTDMMKSEARGLPGARRGPTAVSPGAELLGSHRPPPPRYPLSPDTRRRQPHPRAAIPPPPSLSQVAL